MNALAAILERFNRKERNLLLRDILGCPGKTLDLSPNFCERLAKAVQLPTDFLSTAWWATDFHFDWLAGGLLTFVNGETRERQENPSGLVMGNQEDLDLVVVAQASAPQAQYHLILIEAKAYGYFTKKQYESKVARLAQLYKFYRDMEKESPPRITFHYVLYSPSAPEKLVAKFLPWQTDVAKNPEHVHLVLTLPKPAGSILAVTRCNDDDVPDMQGRFWKCIDVAPRDEAEC